MDPLIDALHASEAARRIPVRLRAVARVGVVDIELQHGPDVVGERTAQIGALFEKRDELAVGCRDGSAVRFVKPVATAVARDVPARELWCRRAFARAE
jgi:hypothetical protein